MDKVQLTYEGASAVVECAGAQIVSFQSPSGQEYIWQRDPDVWGRCSPLLFPVVGSLKDETILIEGKPHKIRKHGPMSRQTFKIGKHGEDFVEMIFESPEEMLEMYPFPVVVHVTTTITKNGFSVIYLVENKSDRVMPMCIGGHPGFICPMQPGESFTDYALVFDQVEDATNLLAPKGYIITGKELLPCFTHTDTLPLEHGLFDERDALILDGLKSRSVRLIHQKTRKGLRFNFDKFDVLGVWTAPGKNADYVCLEPWCGMPALEGETGAFEDKPYVKFVQPGACFKIGFSMQTIE